MDGLHRTIQGRSRRAGVCLALLLASGLAGCGSQPEPDPAVQTPTPAPGAAYQTPPAPTGARLVGGRPVLTGTARPDTRVRVTVIPDPAPIWTTSDGVGGFEVTLPPSTAPRLLALSMEIPATGGPARRVQAEGYVFLAPDGRVALLRAGAGARVLGAATDAIQILSLDFDRAGGVVISGAAPPGASLNAQVDGVSRGRAEADPRGRYAIALEPLSGGQHRFEVAGAGRSATVALAVSPAAPLSVPFRAEAAGSGWRIDWMTPGGGLQSTLVLPPSARP